MRELKIIEYIRKRSKSQDRGIKLGIGDDCAVLDIGAKDYLLWADDMLIDGTHFVSRRDGYKKIGKKAVSVNISDIASMGGVPKYITVSLGLPKSVTQVQIKELYDGILASAKKFNVKVVGGDTNGSKSLVIDISIIGTVEKKNLVTRSKAKKGDVIFVTGPVKNGKLTHFDFTPRVKEARFLAQKYKVNSMIDTSDGIGIDLGRICSESGVGCKLYADDVPLSKGLLLEEALYYGESFELLFTMNKLQAKKLTANRKYKFYPIGEVVSSGEGLSLMDAKGKKKALKVKGYKHL